MWSNGVALVLGLAGFLVAGIAIGTLTGRGRLFMAERAERYEDAVEAGETLVSVHVSDGERDRARSLLREAGALSVPEEGTVEAA
jgi:phosphohistidine swiveling domain-containing protein